MANEHAAAKHGMTFGELLENRRSIRRYQERPVSVQVVQDMIQESTLAPSAGNEQPWKFVVVNDRGWIKKTLGRKQKEHSVSYCSQPRGSCQETVTDVEP